MTADYDLSKLETSQADLWIFLQRDAICAEILARQLDRLTATQTEGQCAEARSWDVPGNVAQMIGISGDPEAWKTWKN